MEDAKGPAMNPLWRRLNTFLNMAKPRMAAIMLQVRHVVGGCCVRFLNGGIIVLVGAAWNVAVERNFCMTTA
jgi:hypothetical protein